MSDTFSAARYDTDYIQVYDGVIPPEACWGLVDRFEQDADRQVAQSTPGYSFTEINVSTCWAGAHRQMIPIYEEVARQYAKSFGLQWMWPSGDLYEAIRLKRYRPGADAFPPHLDAHDSASARRFLVMFLYLNDVAEGGETHFPKWGISIKPKAGRLVAFPPWMPYEHEGRPPISGPKYILGSYCHYPHPSAP